MTLVQAERAWIGCKHICVKRHLDIRPLYTGYIVDFVDQDHALVWDLTTRSTRTAPIDLIQQLQLQTVLEWCEANKGGLWELWEVIMGYGS